MSNTEFWKDLCEYYHYPYYEESDDPFLEDLISKFDFYAKNGKYHMTYPDMELYLDVSYSFLTKKIPPYVESGDILRHGSKNKAEFVLQKYEQQYLDQKQKLDIEKLKPSVADFESIIDLNIYIEKLQLKLIPFNTFANKIYLNNPSTLDPKILSIRDEKDKTKFTFKFLYYKNGSIVIYVDYTSYRIIANLDNFTTLFDYLRKRFTFNNDNTMLPHSFIISQFKGFRKPFEERPKQPINISQSFDLPDLLHYLNHI